MAHFTVTQTFDTEADDPVAAAFDAADPSNDNTIYRIEDDLGRLYEIDLSDDDPQAIPLPPF
jgi:hypothetical protein